MAAVGVVARLDWILDSTASFVRRYVVLGASEVAAVSLWVAHTWAFGAAETTPYLAVTSAEKRSGKTRLLDVLEVIARDPWRTITPTEPVVFRKINASTPTLLLDEVDTIFSRRGEHEGLRALLNAGHRFGSTVPRCVGEGSRLQVVDFKVFGTSPV